ncbi:hypothetical protein Tco_0679541 [Tanacetum coccineum]|uniref:Uncharacterized protein n=1 Tax=Tanacetum coccineum TaxID=301880 RepID=A0ABQ4XJK5_9ASTR
MLSRLELVCNSSNNVLKTFSILFKSTSIGFALGIGVSVVFVSEDEYGELALEEFSEDIKEDEKYFCSAENFSCGTKSSIIAWPFIRIKVCWLNPGHQDIFALNSSISSIRDASAKRKSFYSSGEYDIWKQRIEQYFQVQDYALWDVIENGSSFKPAAQTTTIAEGTSTTLIPDPVTVDEKIQKKNDVKARSMLLMALPNEHLLTFNQYKDAKTFAPSTESLDSIFNRLKKIVSQLAILGENISQEDLNLKFLRSLPSEWNTHVVVWRNKPDLDTMRFDDLYNNFKIVEQEVKGTASSSSSSISTANTQVSTASTQVSTANLSDDTVYAFLASQPNGSHLVHEDLEQIHEDDLEEIDLKWQLALLSMRTRRFYQKTGRKITINGSDTAGYDKSKNQDSSRKTVNVEETSSKAMLAIDGADFDWSFMADEKVPTNMALMDFSDSEFNKSEFNLATYKRGLASVEEHLVFYKKNELEKIKQEKESIQLTIENFDNASKSLDKLIRSQITDNSRKGVGFVSYNAIPPPPIGLFSPPNLDLSNSGLEEFQQPEFEGYGPDLRL